MDSPLGPVTLVASDGALAGVYMERHRHRPPIETFGERDPEPFAGVVEQLTEYFDGARTEFDVPLELGGTPFQRVVWAALRDIPYGETVSYGQLAEQIGRPTASRAVGLANGRNPVSIIVPCHRVVGSGGDLTGYGGGIERKRYLLDFERRVTAGDDALFAPPSAGSGGQPAGAGNSGQPAGAGNSGQPAGAGNAGQPAVAAAK